MTHNETGVQNRLRALRESRGFTVSGLAQRVNVTRQTIYAIEAGTFIPNTGVALRLARELETAVEDLFLLDQAEAPAPAPLATEVLSAVPVRAGEPVRLCRVGPRWVGVPANAGPYYMPEADGLIRRAVPRKQRADVNVFDLEGPAAKRIVLAGCDPATGLLARMAEKLSGIDVVCAAASSRLALKWVREGKAHIAGSHLEDQKTGEFNLPFLQREYPGESFRVITYARWEEGLVMARGNPKGVRGVEDLARKKVRFVNRELGSGSRALVDKLLKQTGIASNAVTGYGQEARGHLAAAWCVSSGIADTCIATRSAAQAFGLDFIPLRSERYDFVMRREGADAPVVQTFLDVLQRASVRRRLEAFASYDTSQMGSVVA